MEQRTPFWIVFLKMRIKTQLNLVKLSLKHLNDFFQRLTMMNICCYLLRFTYLLNSKAQEGRCTFAKHGCF